MTPEQAKGLGLTKAEHGKMQPHEDDEQAVVVEWLTANKVHFFAVPNGQKRTKYEQRQAKRLGMQAGVPDLIITDRPECAGRECPGEKLSYPPHELDHEPRRCRLRPAGVAIEMKRQKPAQSSVSDEQAEWIDHLFATGWITRVCYGAGEAIALLESLGFGRART